MKIAVVGPGQDRAAAGRAVRRPRATGWSAPTSTSASSSWSTPGIEPFPGEAELDEKLGGGRRPGVLRGHHRHRRAVRRADAVVVVVPLFVDAEGEPDFGWMDARDRASRRGLRPGTLVILRDDAAGRHHPQPLGPMLEEGSGLTEGRDFHLVFSPERVLTGRVFADLRKYPKLVGGVAEARRRQGRRVLRGGARLRRAPRPAAANGVWDLGSRRGGRAGQARRDDLPRRQHRPGQPVRAVRRRSRHRRLPGDRGLQLPALQPHPPARASPSAATASRSTRGCTCGTTRTRPWCAPPARRTPRCRSTPSACSRAPTATWPARAWWCSARRTAAG